MDEITVNHCMPDICQDSECRQVICYPHEYYRVPGDGVKAYYCCPLCFHRWTCYWSRSWVFPQEITPNHGSAMTWGLDKHDTLSAGVTKRPVDAMPERGLRSPGSGFVYVARCGKYCKIGYSMTPEQRITNLQTGNPEPVILLGTIEGTQDTEARFHAQFHDKRVRGEWFDLTDNEVQFILSGE
jgi:hypothetical protein